MDEVEVPSYFLCPISLEIMNDPVTVPTGITYNRESIERWLFSSSASSRNHTCPVTKQPVPPDCELTPNHTLRRLIQSWCVINASKGVERIPTPKPPVSRAQVTKLIRDAAKSPQTKLGCLRRLKSIASQSDANKRCIEAAGALEFLASVIHEASCGNGLVTPLIDEALSVLYSLHVSEAKLRNIVDVEIVESLAIIMQTGTYDSRAYAVMLLNKMLEVAEPAQLTCLADWLFTEVVQVLRDRISQRATKAALKLLIHLSPLGRNRIKVVAAGAMPVLLELLLEHNSLASEHIRVCEMVLTAMDILCRSAEGRAELLSHEAGIAVVSKKILRVSHAASERAVRILLSVSRFSGTPRVLEEMLQVGVVTKLCLVLQVECSSRTKETATEILRMNARTWNNSPCVPRSLLSWYPN
ncbi:hypothetical protein CRG98_044327 [Punica granatum]|uniref:U-box domain-containing protein n=1 Tax=Punica granatum TaxID=22663 RepID=A0A2I0HUM1_PUNGR|nr:hypothetical protein CRG98_044327 [Punica granatum]